MTGLLSQRLLSPSRTTLSSVVHCLIAFSLALHFRTALLPVFSSLTAASFQAHLLRTKLGYVPLHQLLKYLPFQKKKGPLSSSFEVLRSWAAKLSTVEILGWIQRWTVFLTSFIRRLHEVGKAHGAALDSSIFLRSISLGEQSAFLLFPCPPCQGDNLRTAASILSHQRRTFLGSPESSTTRSCRCCGEKDRPAIWYFEIWLGRR